MKLFKIIEICQNEISICHICRKELPQEKFIKSFPVSGVLQANNVCWDCRKNHILKRKNKEEKEEKQ